MELSQDKIDFIRENKNEPPKKLAKALGVSVRHVDRALRQLGDADALRRARRVRALKAAVCVIALGGAGYWSRTLLESRRAELGREEARRQEAKARADEGRIYSVLDKREAGHDDEIVVHLDSPDEAVRLGAVRYLLLVGKETKLAKAIEHAYDKSQRVRLATIQLGAKRPCREVDEMLATVASRPGLELAERAIALEALRDRSPASLLGVSAKLLEVLGDVNPSLRKASHELLSRALPSAAIAWRDDASALHSAWRTVLGVRQ